MESLGNPMIYIEIGKLYIGQDCIVEVWVGEVEYMRDISIEGVSYICVHYSCVI